MKKLLIMISCISTITVITACSYSNTQPPIANALAPQLSAKVHEKSKQDSLDKWNITVTPRLGFKAEYLGDSNIQDVEVKSSAGMAVGSNMLQPHNFIGIADGQKVYFGDVDVTVSWSQYDKQFTGKAVFTISKLP